MKYKKKYGIIIIRKLKETFKYAREVGMNMSKIDGRIEQIQRKIASVLEKNSSKSKEEIIEQLSGVETAYAENLVNAFKEMNDDEEIANNTWDRAWESRSGVDFSTDIQKTRRTRSLKQKIL